MNHARSRLLITLHFNLPNHSNQNMSLFRSLVLQGNTGSCKNVEQKIILQLGTYLCPESENAGPSTHSKLILFYHVPLVPNNRVSLPFDK